VKVYPSLDESRIGDQAAEDHRGTDLAFRARAANAWAAGVDGIYVFNQFNPHRPMWRELGDPAVLARLDQDYFASIRGVGLSAGGNLPHRAFQHVETFNPANPRRIEPGASAAVNLLVAQDLATGDPAKLALRLRFKGAAVAGAVVSLNGQRLTDPRVDGEWLAFAPAPAQFRKGQNRVEVRLSPSAPSTADWLDLLLEVRP